MWGSRPVLVYERRKITRAQYVQQYETYVLMGCHRSAANALEQVGLDRRAAVDGAEHAKKRSDSPKRAPAPRLTDRAGLRARRPCDSWHMTARQTVGANPRVSILVVIDHWARPRRALRSMDRCPDTKDDLWLLPLQGPPTPTKAPGRSLRRAARASFARRETNRGPRPTSRVISGLRADRLPIWCSLHRGL